MENKNEFYCRNQWIEEPAFEPCDRQCLDCRLASLEKELNEQADRERKKSEPLFNPHHVITHGVDKGKYVVVLSRIEGEQQICEVMFGDGSKRIIYSKYLQRIPGL